MKGAKPSMRKEKPQIGIRPAKKGEDAKGLGMIKFGKSRQDKTKYILLDFEYDEKAGKELYRIGMEMLAKDKEAVINYVIVEAIKNSAKSKCKK
jgi:hypothetical protein